MQIAIANFQKVDVNLIRHQNGGGVANDGKEIVHAIDQCNMYLPPARAEISSSLVKALLYIPTPDRWNKLPSTRPRRGRMRKAIENDQQGDV